MRKRHPNDSDIEAIVKRYTRANIMPYELAKYVWDAMQRDFYLTHVTVKRIWKVFQCVRDS